MHLNAVGERFLADAQLAPKFSNSVAKSSGLS